MSRWSDLFEVLSRESATLTHRTDADTSTPKCLQVSHVSVSHSLEREIDTPAAPCPTCHCGLWWRVAALSGGPGAWCCAVCAPAPADVWQDACAVPGGMMPAFALLAEAPAPQPPASPAPEPEPPRPSDPAAIEASALSAFRAAECNPAVTITDRAAALTYLRAATASDAARAAKRRQILGWLP